jgi:hypothetical protein
MRRRALEVLVNPESIKVRIRGEIGLKAVQGIGVTVFRRKKDFVIGQRTTAVLVDMMNILLMVGRCVRIICMMVIIISHGDPTLTER